MLPARMAVATILICIGILLLSACGIPLGPAPRARPQLIGSRFAVYTHTPQPRLIATGGIEGTTDTQHIRGYLTFAAPDCLNGQQIELTGALSPTLTLHSRQSTGAQILLRAATSPLYQPLSIQAVPFAGELSRTASCANLSPTAVDTRAIPDLAAIWRGSATGAQGALYAITMRLTRQTFPNGRISLTGTLTVDGPRGLVVAKIDHSIIDPPETARLELAFTDGDVRTITLSTASTVLDDNFHALKARLALHGEPYDNVVLDTVLSSPYPQ